MPENTKNEKVEVIKITRKDGGTVLCEFSEEMMEVAIEQRHLWSTLSVVMMDRMELDGITTPENNPMIFQPQLAESMKQDK